jgi:chitinase
MVGPPWRQSLQISPRGRHVARCTSQRHQNLHRNFQALRSAALLFVTLTCCLRSQPYSGPYAAARPVVAAYVFAENRALTPGEIDAKKLTRVNYAFANIAEGRIVEGASTDAANLAALTALKKDNPQLTVLVSVGGWLWSGRFSDAALTPASRAVFIDSVEAFITRYHLDGLDVDWEYPGMSGAGNTFRPEDKQTYTLLLKDLRHRFDRMAGELHRPLYLTIAAGASSEFLEHTEMSVVAEYVDTVNLMAYDYYEPENGKPTGNHAPLFTDPADPKAVSADRSVREFQKAGVAARKLVLGVPFYGHVWGQVPATNHGLFQPGQPVPNVYANYAAIESTMLGHGYSRYWDAAASVPFLYNAEKQIFVSYEDPESLTAKCKYVKKQHLKGVMFWDYEGDPSGVLLDAIDTALKSGSYAHDRRKAQ